MRSPFVIFALPRSRTAWLSKFLTYGDWMCGHDEMANARSLADVKAWLALPCTGTVETAAAPFWRLLTQLRPDARVVTVRRPVPDVLASMLALGIGFQEEHTLRVLRLLDRKLDQIERRIPNVLRLDYADLAHQSAGEALFETCLDQTLPQGWWDAASPVNVQVNMAHVVRRYRGALPQMMKLARVAHHAMMADLAIHKRTDLSGVTIQTEPFETFYRDAQSLFDEHLVAVGQAPGDHSRKNLDILRTLDKADALQCLTARSRNGLILGYLMTVISPSLDVAGEVDAVHTTFYASKDAPGLGMKLQRAALDALRARGVDEVTMRAGIVGSGPRMGAIYKRLGADEIGTMYSLRLEH